MLGDRNSYSSFAVKDIGDARRFYEETLGLRTSVVSEEMGLMTLHLANGRDVFVYAKDDHRPANYTILNFEVDDVEAAVDGLNERGVEFERYEGFDQDEKGINRFTEDAAIAWFTDPSGNIFAVATPM